MKTAIYIEDGVIQLVITPESDFEKNAVSQFEGDHMETKIFSGTFYDCRGGWTRQAEHFRDMHFGGSHKTDNNDKSLIIRTQTAPVREGKPGMSDERISEIFDSLGGVDAFLKTFGYQHFARAILDEQKEQR